MVDLTDARATTGVEPIYKGAPHTLYILLPYIAAAAATKRERESSWSLSLVLMVYARHHKQARANYQGFIRLLTYPHSLPRRLERSQIFNRTLPPRTHSPFCTLAAAKFMLGAGFQQHFCTSCGKWQEICPGQLVYLSVDLQRCRTI